MTTATATRPADLRDPGTILGELAKTVVAEHPDNPDEAEAQMRYHFRKDRQRWTDVLVSWAAGELVRRERLRSRASIAGVMRAPATDRGLRSLGSDFKREIERIAQWPLSSGVSVIKATRKDLAEEEATYRAQGRTMMVRADWFALLQAKMGAAETVGEAMDADTIYELHQEAEKRWEQD